MKRAIVPYRIEAKAAPYLAAMRDAGVNPIPVTPDAPVESLDGAALVLTGGTDVDPALYGRETDPRTDPPDHQRDALEFRLLREALRENLPVLAICRGMQLFNVAHPAGTLTQHLEGHQLTHNGTHEIEIYGRSQLAAILGAGVHPVNSRHHQAVEKVGEGLIVSARSPEGVVEGLERPGLRFAIAVQWHPEDMVANFPVQRKLFAAFAHALEG